MLKVHLIAKNSLRLLGSHFCVCAQICHYSVLRLRSVFEQVRKHNLYLKANIRPFDFKEVEFVGQVLSEEGLKISFW